MIQPNTPSLPARKTPEATPGLAEAVKVPPPEWKRRNRPRESPVLRFSPAAWAKLLYFRDRGPTEIGGFAVTAADDLLYVEQFVTIRQAVTAVSVAFDDEAVGDFFDGQVDAGRKPEQFGRVWLHTHPGESAEPSCVDHETFTRVFGGCQWAVMFVLGQTGKTTARLRFNVGPGGHVAVPVEVDYSRPFAASDEKAWEAEYRANIHPEFHAVGFTGRGPGYGLADDGFGLAGGVVPPDLLDDLRDMEPAERMMILDELAADADFWGQGQREVVHEF